MTPFQSDFSAASSINKKGEKVGGYVNSDGFFRAVLWGKQGVRELGTLGGDESEAYWIGEQWGGASCSEAASAGSQAPPTQVAPVFSFPAKAARK